MRGLLRQGARGLELAEEGEVPVPDTVREAVLIGASELSEQAREAAEVAAVAGQRFELGLAAELATAEGLQELIDRVSSRRTATGALSSGTGWRGRRSTPRCPGCAAASSTAGSRKRWNETAAAAWRSPIHWDERRRDLARAGGAARCRA